MRFALISLTLVLTLLVPTKNVFTQVVLAIDDISLAPSATMQTGSFEVRVSHELAISPSLAGFQATLTLFNLSSAPSARFTGTKAPIDRAYAFAPNSAPVSIVSDGGTVVQIGDFLLENLAEVNDDSALALVNFELPGGVAVGDEYRIEISIAPDETFLATDLSGRIPLSVDNARIRVANAVPEPGTTSLLMILSCLCLACTGRQGRSLS